MIDLTPILKAVIALAVAIITYILIPYIKSKTTSQQQSDIKEWVKIAVSAAEQIYVGHGRGKEKKEFVLSWLESNGYRVDETKLDALIEAAVYEINSAFIVAEGIEIKE